MSEENSQNNSCTLQRFYEGMRNIDPTLIKKQSFQQGEIYVFMKSVTITPQLLTRACGNEDDNTLINSLIVESNQILTLGYRNVNNNFTITVDFSNDVKVVLFNGATLIIFKENILINNGELIVINSSLCLESNHNAKFVNNGTVELRNSQLFGTGILINNNQFKATGYSKVFLGRLKESLKVEDETQLALSNDDSFLYDFGQNSTKFINAGELLVSGYSLFDLYGFFVNGKSDLSESFIIDTILIEDNKISDYRPFSTIFIKSNSKFLFTIGESSTVDGFVNDTNGLIISENNTYLRFNISSDINAELLRRKNVINRGIMILNGESYFISVNFENYCVLKNTIHNISNYVTNGVTFGNNFNYSKIIFLNNRCDFVPSIKNIGNRSLIQISSTSSLHVFGYNFINQGTIGIGISKDNIGLCDEKHKVSLDLNVDNNENIIINDEDNIRLIDTINEIKINGEFLYGFMETNNCLNTTFKNWGNIYSFLKSRVIIGYNSSSVINGKRQVMMFNYGLIRNWGYLKICRFSEIINLPSFPFNDNCKLYGIINGSNINIRPCISNCQTICRIEPDNSIECAVNLNAILIVARPIPSVTNNVFTGGFIKSENKIFPDCSTVKNLTNGVIITWFGYEELDDSLGQCTIVYGIDDKNLKTTSSGKIVPLPYPNNFDKWPKSCLSKFLEDQSLSFNFDFKLS